MFLHSQPTGTVDPLFQADISFYLFRLPFIGGAVSAAFGAVLLTTLATLALYVATNNVAWARPGNPSAIKHLSGLVAVLLVLQAASYRIDAYRLVYSPRSPFSMF